MIKSRYVSKSFHFQIASVQLPVLSIYNYSCIILGPIRTIVTVYEERIIRLHGYYMFYVIHFCNTKNTINNQICKSCELLRIITYASGELLFTNKTSFVNIAIIFASLTWSYHFDKLKRLLRVGSLSYGQCNLKTFREL